MKKAEKVLYVFGGPEFHPTEWAGKELTQILAANGSYAVEMTNDLDAFAKLPRSNYAAVVVYTTGFVNDLTPAREKGLLEYVRKGGGFVGIHSASDSFRGSRKYVEMINGEFLTHPHHHEFNINIVDKNHYLTARMPNFSVFDEMYHLQNFNPAKTKVLAETIWQGAKKPMAYAHSYGKGRVAYVALGHTAQCWKHPDFRTLMLRAVNWSAGADLPKKVVHCGILGYGPAFNMGKGHAGWINETPGMKTIAMCDSSQARVDAAKQELPGMRGYFTSLDQMLRLKDLDLVVNILPHNQHYAATMQCLKAGKHVVQEKPFCITVEEADNMIELAHKRGLMLSLFHNRRWDGDYLTIRDIIDRGLIGEVFHVECGQGSYGHPGFWWRSDKAVSGGVMHDWGAHFIDWILNLVPSKVTQVMGNFQKRVWHMVTNEDFGQVYIKFENGCTADYLISSISASSRPKWRINGTLGSIEQNWGDITLVSFMNGVRQDSTIKVTLPGYGSTQYYRNVADHLLLGEDLIVKPEQARRVIGIIEAGQISAKRGTSVPPCPHCE